MDLNQIGSMLKKQAYITDKSVEMSVYLSMQLEKPLLVEGPAGVGKTEIAKVLAAALETDLIRLQCYEGAYKITIGQFLSIPIFFSYKHHNNILLTNSLSSLFHYNFYISF